MQRIKGFGIKFIGIGMITSIIYATFNDANVGSLLFMTVVIASLSYIGDLFIFPRINHILAAVLDFALYFILYYFLGSIIVDGGIPLLLSAFAASYLAAIGEAIFHMYLIDYVFDERYVNPFPGKFQTELAQETDVKSVLDEYKSLGKDGKKEEEQ